MASLTKRPRYTEQAIAMIDPATNERLLADAFRFGLSKSEVMRTYLVAGIESVDARDAALEDSPR